MIIRDARESDATSIKALLGQLGYPDLSEKEVVQKIAGHSRPFYHMLVAEVGGRPIAFSALHWFEMLHRKGHIGRITAFCVDEKFRSQGIGQQLLKSSEEFLRQQDCARLEVTSNIKRTGAHRFYLKSGFLEDSLRFVKN
jgi:GNAT superfamily N-acetyltransferase